jgi:hypothetical protein
MTETPSEPTPDRKRPGPLLSIKAAATACGVKYWLLLLAVNNGEVPSYQLGNARRRVRVSDIEDAINRRSQR